MRRVNSSTSVNSPSPSLATLSQSLPSSTNMLPTDTYKANTKAAKTARRMLKKACAARASRRRKKAYTALLHERLNKLQQKLQSLQSNSTVEDSIDAVESEYIDTQARVIFQLQQCMSGEHTATNEFTDFNNTLDLDTTVYTDPTQNTVQLQHLIQQYITLIYSRMSQIIHKLLDIEPKFMPTITLKFLLWMLSQNNDFYNVNNTQSQWIQFITKFQLNTIQIHDLLNLRGTVADLIRSIQQCQNQLLRTQQSLQLHIDTRRQHIDTIQTLLTQEQLGEFILYADTQLITYPDVVPDNA